MPPALAWNRHWAVAETRRVHRANVPGTEFATHLVCLKGGIKFSLNMTSYCLLGVIYEQFMSI